MKIYRLHVSRRVFSGFMIVTAMVLLVVALVRTDGPQQKPDPAHVVMVQQKQSAWLEKHPLMLKISRSQIAGVPGDLLTSAYWHLLGVMRPHPHGERPPATAQTANRRG